MLRLQTLARWALAVHLVDVCLQKMSHQVRVLAASRRFYQQHTRKHSFVKDFSALYMTGS